MWSYKKNYGDDVTGLLANGGPLDPILAARAKEKWDAAAAIGKSLLEKQRAEEKKVREEKEKEQADREKKKVEEKKAQEKTLHDKEEAERKRLAAGHK